MKITNERFEELLRRKGITKKAFSAYSGIAYYTVAGWKKSGNVPAYVSVLLHRMPSARETVSAGEMIAAGLPRAILWNSDSHKQVPVDIFIVSTLQKAYNDFVIDKLAELFGEEKVLAALLKHKTRISDRLARRVIDHLQELPRSV